MLLFLITPALLSIKQLHAVWRWHISSACQPPTMFLAAAWPLTSPLVKCSRNASCLEDEPAAWVLTCHSEVSDINATHTGHKVDVDERKPILAHVLIKYFHQQYSGTWRSDTLCGVFSGIRSWDSVCRAMINSLYRVCRKKVWAALKCIQTQTQSTLCSNKLCS